MRGCLLLQDFVKNNRGINDGGDLPLDYMNALYDRIVNDEIKMKVRLLGPGKDSRTVWYYQTHR